MVWFLKGVKRGKSPAAVTLSFLTVGTVEPAALHLYHWLWLLHYGGLYCSIFRQINTSFLKLLLVIIIYRSSTNPNWGSMHPKPGTSMAVEWELRRWQYYATASRYWMCHLERKTTLSLVPRESVIVVIEAATLCSMAIVSHCSWWYDCAIFFCLFIGCCGWCVARYFSLLVCLRSNL